ncbi:MAG: hypothetical protein JSR69_21065 [Proteobacteria bacterium]|nr:hypothetical protein [Pseudomonadota bacterium]
MRTLDDAVSLLWERAADRLTLKELDSLTGSTDEAILMAQNLARTCGNLGALVGDDETGGWLREPEDVSALLYGIQNQVQMIHTLAWLGERARCRADDLLGWTAQAQCDARGRRAQP